MLTPSEYVIHCTVRIECVLKDGNSSSGTGFYYQMFQTANSFIPVIVTNKHVVKDSTIGRFHITLASEDGTPKYGSHIQIELDDFEKRWIGHPDPNVDLAVTLCGPILNEMKETDKKPFFKSLSQTLIQSDNSLKNLNSVEEITMVGYPNGIWDSINNIPIVRRGITATPIYLDYAGKKEFVIDAACFPGSSGSPVFILNEGSFSDKNSGLIAGNRLIFVGILYAGPQMTTQGDIIVVDVPTDQKAFSLSKLMINLGYCIKASRVVEFEPHLMSMGMQPPSGWTPSPLK